MAGALRERLLEALDERCARMVRALGTRAAEKGWPSYVVGGAVRDFLLGRPVVEADVAVVGDAAELAARAAEQAGAALVLFRRFGTARLVVEGAHVDVAPARTERYPRPGALPRVAPAPAIEEDLARRDFTINAMAVPLACDERELVDPRGGRQDLERRLLRALYRQSFLEDGTRLFRAVRFSVRYALRIEPRTRGWMRQALDRRAVDRISAQRRGQEVRRVLAEWPVLPMARAMQRWRLWEAACPAWRLTARAARVLGHLDEHGQGSGAGAAEVALVAVAEGWLGRKPGPFSEQVEALVRRLSLTRHERRALEALPGARLALAVLNRAGAGRVLPSTAQRLLRGLPPACLDWLVAASGGPTAPAAGWVEWYRREGRWLRPALTGQDLLALGCPPGPLVGKLLEALHAARLDGRIRTRADEVAWVRRRLALLKTGGPGREDRMAEARGPAC